MSMPTNRNAGTMRSYPIPDTMRNGNFQRTGGTTISPVPIQRNPVYNPPHGLNMNKPAMSAMQVMRGKSGQVVVSSAYPFSDRTNHQRFIENRNPNSNQIQISYVRPPAPNTKRTIDACSSAIDFDKPVLVDRASSAVARWTPLGINKSSDIEFSIYPSNNSNELDEDVLSASLRAFDREGNGFRSKLFMPVRIQKLF